MPTRKKAALYLAAAAVVLAALPAPAFAQFPFFDHASGLRFQVEPAETEIFIDGYYVGRVDDYDGFFQRLRFPPGEHDIELYLNGYRSAQQKVLVQPGATFRVRHTMEALKPGDTPDARPVAPARPPGATRPPDPRDASAQAEFGSLAIRVQPGDADIVIDGERWAAPQDNDRLIVQLPAGPHRVEIRRNGFGAYTSTVDIRRGDTTTLNVSLDGVRPR